MTIDLRPDGGTRLVIHRDPSRPHGTPPDPLCLELTGEVIRKLVETLCEMAVSLTAVQDRRPEPKEQT